MRIVPTNRLLVWVTLVVLPFGTLASVAPDYAPVAIASVLAFAALVLFDAALSIRKLDGIQVSLPELVRLVKNRPGLLPVEIENPNERPLRLRIGLPLPRQIWTDAPDWTVQLPVATARSRTQIRCTPVERGQHRLAHAHIETPSALGFWGIRSVSPIKSELRVYPDLWSERKQVAAIFLNRGLFGRHAQRQIGKGRDFEKLREYVPGDSFDELHWKATARRGRPITKVFQIERTQEVYVVLDISRLSARLLSTRAEASHLQHVSNASMPGNPAQPADAINGVNGLARSAKQPADAQGRHSSPPTALERFITAALVLGLAAEQQGDFFGLVVFSDKVQSFVRAKTGRAHFNACRDALYALKPHIVTPDLEEVNTFIRLRLRRRALLVFLTALDDPLLADSFVQNVDYISRQHVVLVNMIRPAGVEPFFNAQDVAGADELYNRLGGQLLWQHLRELEKVLQRRGVRLSLVDEERLTAQITSDYLRIKARQLL